MSYAHKINCMVILISFLNINFLRSMEQRHTLKTRNYLYIHFKLHPKKIEKNKKKWERTPSFLPQESTPDCFITFCTPKKTLIPPTQRPDPIPCPQDLTWNSSKKRSKAQILYGERILSLTMNSAPITPSAPDKNKKNQEMNEEEFLEFSYSNFIEDTTTLDIHIQELIERHDSATQTDTLESINNADDSFFSL